MTSAEVREQILDSLILNLVGPVAGLKVGNYVERRSCPNRPHSCVGRTSVSSHPAPPNQRRKPTKTAASRST